jgi:hypothetical protein
MKKKIKGKWYVYDSEGERKLGGPYLTEAAANKRIRQVEHFKRRGR